MTAKTLNILFALLLVFSAALPALAQPEAAGPIYRFDPALSVADPPEPTISAGPQVVVDKDEAKTSVRLQSEVPFSPYVDAARGPELSAEERRLLPEGKESGGLSDYKLEAGVGLFVEDKASLNLGYRFHEHPSLLGERRNDPLTLSGDLRISFDVKIPFD